MSAMGERFILYRMPRLDTAEQARKALRNAGRQQEMESTLADLTCGLLDTIDYRSRPPLSGDEEDLLVELSTLVTTCRSATIRDGYKRDAESVPQPELPARLVGVLSTLLAGMKLIGIICPERRQQLIYKIGMESVPPVRRVVLEHIAECGPATADEIVKAIAQPSTTVRRSLEDLEYRQVVVQGSKKGMAFIHAIVPEWLERIDFLRAY
jgi:hypothetical protein